MGILVGSVPDNSVTEEEKKQIYKIYRFLNVVHIMCYKSFMRDEFKNDDNIYSQLVKLNLLTEEEGVYLGSMGKKVREGLCSGILCEIDVLVSLTKKKYAESKSVVLNEKICDLRGTMAKLHDTFIRGRFQNDCVPIVLQFITSWYFPLLPRFIHFLRNNSDCFVRRQS